MRIFQLSTITISGNSTLLRQGTGLSQMFQEPEFWPEPKYWQHTNIVTEDVYAIHPRQLKEVLAHPLKKQNKNKSNLGGRQWPLGRGISGRARASLSLIQRAHFKWHDELDLRVHVCRSKWRSEYSEGNVRVMYSFGRDFHFDSPKNKAIVGAARPPPISFGRFCRLPY